MSFKFICGSFRTQEEDDYDVLWPFPSPRKPTRSRRQIFGSRRKDKTATNPYSDRGIDKFEALLADLDKKRQKILTQKGAEDVSMVKFIYRGSNEAQPIVVKLRKYDNISSLSTRESDHQTDVAFNEPEEVITKPSVDEPDENIRFDQCKRKFAGWWKPSYYLPLFVMLILVLLMFSGRSFTILCTSVGWYLVPIINESLLHDSKQPKNITKKEYLKRSPISNKHHNRSF
ncbi:hypothetical protein L1987_66409 [Smallanthus sonchifolius]|uniref:Uncharacterized protein n=1 Tax=Smallanthus sonchifolius TaxID=185202 RepID=A0ACB9BX76_9ASTR|nr:hypothetical protein L1987_66409 [Smallanthus sonchifolius]